MEWFVGDKCPGCGEEREIEYGNVYAEGGEAWHSCTCLKCDTHYTATYKFDGIIDTEYSEKSEPKPKKVKRIEVRGSIQLWDMYDERFDVAPIRFDVPESAWPKLTDEEIEGLEDEWGASCDDGTVTTRLFKMALDEGWVKVDYPGWEWEDPFDLCGYVEYEEE